MAARVRVLSIYGCRQSLHRAEEQFSILSSRLLQVLNVAFKVIRHQVKRITQFA